MALRRAVFRALAALWVLALLCSAGLLLAGASGEQLAQALHGWVSSGFEAQLRQWADSLQHQYAHQGDSAGSLSSTLAMMDGVFRLWSLLLSAFWKELLIVLVCLYMPAFKAQLYDWVPDWLWDLSRWSWDDDTSNIPDLEPCSGAEDANEDPADDENDRSAATGSVVGPAAARTQQFPPDWLVYDPVMGVLPREVLEVWRKQEPAREHEVQRAIAREQSHKLPPVRFSEPDVL